MRTLLLYLLCFPTISHAGELAVLPLDKGSGSAEYDGLGRALSGMLVADFSAAGVDLVERERIDAVLGELDLNQTDFVDPASAVKFGKGFGADMLAVGTWSVVENTFLMDVRLVDTETGSVVKAARADGPVADFIGVEKAILEDLLAGLAVELAPGARRKLMMATPTEVFDALTKYAEGQQRELEGRIDEARKAYDAAVQVDPQFAEAQASLSGLAESIAQTRATTNAVGASAIERASQAILAATTDERSRAKDFTHTAETRGAFLLRTVALQNLGLDCQREAEMLAYLEHVDWSITRDQNAVQAATALAETHGLSRQKGDGPPIAQRQSLRERLAIGKSLPAFLLHKAQWWAPGAGLHQSTVACYPPEAALQKLDRLAREVETRGHGDESLYSLPLRDDLALGWAYHHATALGATAELNQRLAALLARHPVGSSGHQKVLNTQEHHILSQAKQWNKNRLSRAGLSTEDILEVSRQVAASGTGLTLDTAACKAAQANAFRHAGRQVAFYEEWIPKGVVQHDAINGLAAQVLVLRDFGCTGMPARFSSVEDVVGFIGAQTPTANAKADPTCASLFILLEGTQKPEALAVYLSSEERGTSQTPWLLQSYYQAAGAGCFEVPW